MSSEDSSVSDPRYLEIRDSDSSGHDYRHPSWSFNFDYTSRSLDMPQIHLLDPETVAKMAAGEVIQRPFNAAKELIENATDADAPAIGLFVSNNCYDLIMVYDTGHGIELADYPSYVTALQLAR